MATIMKSQTVAALTEEALIGGWTNLAAIDRTIGHPASAEEAETLEEALERIDEIEAALLSRRSTSEDGIRARLRILARAIESGADAAHIVSIFDRCRADFVDHGAVSLAG